MIVHCNAVSPYLAKVEIALWTDDLNSLFAQTIIASANCCEVYVKIPSSYMQCMPCSSHSLTIFLCYIKHTGIN